LNVVESGNKLLDQEIDLQNTDLIIRQEISIPAPIQQVWQFLMNESNMKRWFGADEFLIDIIEGGKVEIPLKIKGEKVLIEGEIGLILPMEKFAFTWIERDILGEAWFNNTTVTIGLEDGENLTVVSLEHDGFKYLPEDTRLSVYNKYAEFWTSDGMLQRMHNLIINE
jgi:uncharacterized protein YndB with AHSA1/START domain